MATETKKIEKVETQLPPQGLPPQFAEVKARKKMSEPHALVDTVTEHGIELGLVVFREAVTSAEGTPETAYYQGKWAKGHKTFRTARLWYTPHGVVVSQLEQLIIVPLANVRYAKAL